MRVYSYMRQANGLEPIEVELTLQPGLPQIVFLGLPDASVRESAVRIRSALRKTGYHLPKAQKILVQLKPSHIKKTSLGLDLAVAAAIIWETNQAVRPETIPILYGGLSLTGEVEIPIDTAEIDVRPTRAVLTGKSQGSLPFSSIQIRSLRDLTRPLVLSQASGGQQWVRPQVNVRSFPKPVAELGMLIAAGEHSALLAGPPGTGKSTLAEALVSWLQEPSSEAASHARRFSRLEKQKPWRPLVRPHHTISKLAMIGGGNTAWSGEISRAHGGVLLLDEVLKFSSDILEALREPCETGHIAIARGGRAVTYPAKFLLVGTTNLCDCGKFVPSAELSGCSCTGRARRRVLQRLTGPFLDRFAVLAYSNDWLESYEQVLAQDLAEKVRSAIEFRRKTRQQVVPNACVDGAQIEASLSSFQKRHLLSDSTRISQRRRDAVLRVARTYADLDSSLTIRHQDLNSAEMLCLEGHRRLTEWPM